MMPTRRRADRSAPPDTKPKAIGGVKGFDPSIPSQGGSDFNIGLVESFLILPLPAGRALGEGERGNSGSRAQSVRPRT